TFALVPLGSISSVMVVPGFLNYIEAGSWRTLEERVEGMEQIVREAIRRYEQRRREIEAGARRLDERATELEASVHRLNEDTSQLKATLERLHEEHRLLRSEFQSLQGRHDRTCRRELLDLTRAKLQDVLGDISNVAALTDAQLLCVREANGGVPVSQAAISLLGDGRLCSSSSSSATRDHAEDLADANEIRAAIDRSTDWGPRDDLMALLGFVFNDATHEIDARQ
ncbi:hypothetical protein HK405_004385, partial [Cladochytrium tenue]